MRQPVSRITFDRRRGFLGVHLQEGALFVDAAWNEAADIAWSQLRDAIVAAGVAGTLGRELRIDPIVDDAALGGPLAAEHAVTGQRKQLRNLLVCGTSADGSAVPRPFYCNGLPVLWLADLPIDAQPLGDAFRSEATRATATPAGGNWIELLQDLPYEIFLCARVETLDGLDLPALDDPGLGATRGTFRKRVVGEVRIRKADAPRSSVGSNVRLSVDGSYLSDLNALYRVELVEGWGSQVSVLWDPDAAATVACVVEAAREGAREVMVDTTEGFDAGYVRFEGRGVGPALYRVAKAPGREGSAVHVTRHRCDRAELSLATWQIAAPRNDLPPDRFEATFVAPLAAPVQASDVLHGLPAALGLSWNEATVVAVTAFDANRSLVTLTLEQAASNEVSSRALSIASWRATGPAIQGIGGAFSAVLEVPLPIREGDIVMALPPSLGPSSGPLVVLSHPVVKPQSAGAPQLVVRFGPAGLAQQLVPLDTRRRAILRRSANALDATVVVDARRDWIVGERVRIVHKGHEGPGKLDAAELAKQEVRTIVRILHLDARDAGRPPEMVVRFDHTLSYAHDVGEEVVPETPVHVRRFAGHECRLGVDRIDPAQQEAASIANFSSALALPGGLALHLTIENTETAPRICPGDGWHFAARGDGWYETPAFAPVEEEPASEVPLARLTITGTQYELLDLRPLPASHAMDEDLARVDAAAELITQLIQPGPLTQLLEDVSRLARTPRLQRRLVQRLRELADSHHPRLYANPRCRQWLQQLHEVLAPLANWANHGPHSEPEPTRRQLAAIAFAISGLAFALSADPPGLDKPGKPEPKPPVLPAKSKS